MEIPENTKQEAIKRLTDRYLFRGFSKEKKRWFFGSLTAIMLPSERFSTTIIYQDKTKTYVQIEVDPESVGMFVCKYKDLYIFEGDIIHIILGDNSARDFGVVTYSQKNGNFFVDDTFGAIPKDGGKPVGEFLSSVEQLKFKDRHPEIYIKGNIFDRPELKKKNVEPLPF